MIKDIHEIKQCPDCGNVDLTYNTKENQVLCKECGLIYEPLEPSREKTFEKTHNLQ